MVKKGTLRQGNYPSAKYLYPSGPKHPYEWIVCVVCGESALVKAHGKGFCSKHCAQMGTNNSNFTPNPTSYNTAHQRVYRTRGPAREQTCKCGKQAHDWANLTGDYQDVWDYAAMCVPCHVRYDQSRR